MSIKVTVNGNPVCMRRGKMLLTDPDVWKKNEFHRRRKLRIEQVRQQSKDVASRLRKEFRKERDKQLSEFEEEQIAEMKRLHARKLLNLQQKYEDCLRSVGTGHARASDEPDPAMVLAEQQRRNLLLAEQRGREAQEREKIENMALEREKERLAEQYRQNRTVEDLRSAMVASIEKSTRNSVTDAKTPLKSISNIPPRNKHETGVKSSFPFKRKNVKKGSTKSSRQIPSLSGVSSPDEDESDSEVNIQPSSKAGTSTRPGTRPDTVTGSDGQVDFAAGIADVDVVESDDSARYRISETEIPTVLETVTQIVSQLDEDSHKSERQSTPPVAKPRARPKVVKKVPVQFYDHSARFHREYSPPPVVKRIIPPKQAVESSVDLEQQAALAAQAAASEAERAALQERRGNQAIAKERAKRDYQQLMGDLDTLSREERRLRSVHPPGTDADVFMTDERRQASRRNRQRRMDSAFEGVLHAAQYTAHYAEQHAAHHAGSVAGDSSRPHSVAVTESFSTTSSSHRWESSPATLNVGQAAAPSPAPTPSTCPSPLPSSSPTPSPTGSIVVARLPPPRPLPAMNLPRPADADASLERLMERVHAQRTLLLDEVARGGVAGSERLQALPRELPALKRPAEREMSFSSTSSDGTNVDERRGVHETRPKEVWATTATRETQTNDRVQGRNAHNVHETVVKEVWSQSKDGELRRTKEKRRRRKDDVDGVPTDSNTTSRTVVSEYSVSKTELSATSNDSSTTSYQGVKVTVSVTEETKVTDVVTDVRTRPRSPGGKRGGRKGRESTEGGKERVDTSNESVLGVDGRQAVDSSSTAYNSPPGEVNAEGKGSVGRLLETITKQQRQLDDWKATVEVPPKKTLEDYVDILLAMPQEAVDALTDASPVSTPASSILDTSRNHPEDPLDDLLQARIAEISRELSQMDSTRGESGAGVIRQMAEQVRERSKTREATKQPTDKRKDASTSPLTSHRESSAQTDHDDTPSLSVSTKPPTKHDRGTITKHDRGTITSCLPSRRRKGKDRNHDDDKEEEDSYVEFNPLRTSSDEREQTLGARECADQAQLCAERLTVLNRQLELIRQENKRFLAGHAPNVDVSSTNDSARRTTPESSGHGQDSSGHGRDSSGHGQDSLGHGRDSLGLGRDSSGHGRDSSGRDIRDSMDHMKRETPHHTSLDSSNISTLHSSRGKSRDSTNRSTLDSTRYDSPPGSVSVPRDSAPPAVRSPGVVSPYDSSGAAGERGRRSPSPRADEEPFGRRQMSDAVWEQETSEVYVLRDPRRLSTIAEVDSTHASHAGAVGRYAAQDVSTRSYLSQGPLSPALDESSRSYMSQGPLLSPAKSSPVKTSPAKPSPAKASPVDLLPDVMEEMLRRRLITSPPLWAREREAASRGGAEERGGSSRDASQQAEDYYPSLLADVPPGRVSPPPLHPPPASRPDATSETRDTSDGSNATAEDLEGVFTRLGYGWASATLRKTRASKDLSSSSSPDEPSSSRRPASSARRSGTAEKSTPTSRPTPTSRDTPALMCNVSTSVERSSPPNSRRHSTPIKSSANRSGETTDSSRRSHVPFPARSDLSSVSPPGASSDERSLTAPNVALRVPRRSPEKRK